MNKKGFISISVVYSFFLVFIAIVLSILAAYSSRRYMLIGIKDDIRNVIDGKTTYNCFSKGITKLNDCIIDIYGGKEYIESQESPDFSVATVAGEQGLYSIEDDLGKSYYFRGDVKNNYVMFGQDDDGKDMYWRIVRINGDGTIRLIYDGYNALENGYNPESCIEYNYYNNASNLSKYVGYTYNDGTGKQINSTIKNIVDNWYENNLMDYYSEYLADGIFCNDRSLDSSAIDYASDQRVINSVYNSIKCTNKADRYTMDDVINGNGNLTYPIAILSVDEIAIAGASIHSSNETMYLNRDGIWTMTPTYYSSFPNRTALWIFSSAGNISHYYDEYDIVYFADKIKLGIRPVINLKANVEIKKGNGTISSPFVLEEVNF